MGRIANIRVTDQTGDKGGLSLIELGSALVSVASHSQNESNLNMQSQTATSAADEQGIRAFLFKLMNSKHLFTTSDMVDQIEAFI